MSPPTVTVVIPTRNRPEMLIRALRSVGAQTYRGFETLVVDDGSAPPLDAAPFPFDLPRLRVLRHEIPRGAAAARNRGIAEARGRFVAFLDDDDEWLPEKLAKQVGKMEGAPDEVGAVVCGYRVVSDVTGKTDRHVDTSWHPFTPAAFIRSTGFMTTVPLLRADRLREAGGFDEDLPGCQDKDLWIRIARRWTFDAVPEELAVHHIHGEQITTELGSKIRAKEAILEKHGDLLAGEPGVLAHQLERIGILHAVAGEPGRARRRFLEAMAADPKRTSLYRHLALSHGDPAAFRRHIEENVLAVVDGILLYY